MNKGEKKMKCPWFAKEIIEMPEVVEISLSELTLQMIVTTESKKRILIRYVISEHELPKIKEVIKNN